MQRRNERFVERLPLLPGRSIYSYLLTILLCAMAFCLRVAASGVLPPGYPFVTFFPAVIIASFLFGVRPGIFAGVLCGLLSWYFFIPPYHRMDFNPAVAVALMFYIFVVTVDILLIHFMQCANFNLGLERERNHALAENRELLFRELQHRVSNNLQVAAAMLGLQRRHVDHDVARRALDDASARLALIGRISRALYDPTGAGQDIRAFLTTLADDLLDASGRDDVRVSVSAPDTLALDPNVTVPLALIVAEAVSNAIEHGMPDCAGAIDIRITLADDAFCLEVSDDGKGIAPDYEIGSGPSLGLRIAAALATQLGGEFALRPGRRGGAVARLDLPAASVS